MTSARGGTGKTPVAINVAGESIFPTRAETAMRVLNTPDYVEGVVDRDGEFVVWTTPKVDIEDAAG